MDVVRESRSIRRYTRERVPAAIIDQILETAIWAPPALNRQPWRFVLMDDSITRENLAQAMGKALAEDLTADGMPLAAIQRDVERSYQRISSAPEDMDRYPDERQQSCEQLMAVQSTAMAGHNLLLAAHALGPGGCWLCALLFCPEVVAETLGLPRKWLPQGLMTMGYPEESRHRARRPLLSVMWQPAG